MLHLNNVNHKLKHEYDRLFKKDPMAANLFLLLTELADKWGKVEIEEKELTKIMNVRFDNPRRYSL